MWPRWTWWESALSGMLWWLSIASLLILIRHRRLARKLLLRRHLLARILRPLLLLGHRGHSRHWRHATGAWGSHSTGRGTVLVHWLLLWLRGELRVQWWWHVGHSRELGLLSHGRLWLLMHLRGHH